MNRLDDMADRINCPPMDIAKYCIERDLQATFEKLNEKSIKVSGMLINNKKSMLMQHDSTNKSPESPGRFGL
jgi:hypothetical protein